MAKSTKDPVLGSTFALTDKQKEALQLLTGDVEVSVQGVIKDGQLYITTYNINPFNETYLHDWSPDKAHKHDWSPDN